MFGLGFPELIIILVIVIMIFGAGKLPEIGGAIGKGIRSFKRASKDVDKSEKPSSEEQKDKKASP